MRELATTFRTIPLLFTLRLTKVSAEGSKLEERLLISPVGDARARNSAASQELRDVLGGLSGCGAELSLNAFRPRIRRETSPSAMSFAATRSNLGDELVKRSLDVITCYADGALCARLKAISAAWYQSPARLTMSDGSTIRCPG
jgi:hypothetical protein